MNNTRVENWNNNSIRFVKLAEDEWWAVGNDVAKALGYSLPQKAITDHVDIEDMKTLTYKAFSKTEKANLWKGADKSNKTVINQYGIYSLIFASKLPEAKQFKHWVVDMLDELRKEAGLEQYEVLKTLDAQYQKQMMSTLKTGLKLANKVDYIKANTITDKAVSNDFGFDKMVKKRDMSPAMLAERQKKLAGVVSLMVAKEQLGLDMSVSKAVYNKKAM